MTASQGCSATCLASAAARPRVDAMGGEVALAVGAGDRARRVDVDVGQLDFVAAGFRQQAGDQRTDLAGAQDEYAMHREFT